MRDKVAVTLRVTSAALVTMDASRSRHRCTADEARHPGAGRDPARGEIVSSDARRLNGRILDFRLRGNDGCALDDGSVQDERRLAGARHAERDGDTGGRA